MTDDDEDLQLWHEIESESDAEFQENHGIVEEVKPASEDNTINPTDCYRHTSQCHASEEKLENK